MVSSDMAFTPSFMKIRPLARNYMDTGTAVLRYFADMCFKQLYRLHIN